MKKILFTILMLSLLAQFAIAKDVTVIFNFPEGTSPDVQELVSLPEDSNSFRAFVTLAGQEGLELDMAYYESFGGWFINGINGVSGSAEQYWHFWVDNEESMVGISAHVPANGEVIELGFADEPRGIEKTPSEKAIGWLVENQKADGEIGVHKTWGNAFALVALSLFGGNEGVKQKAVDYVLLQQGEDAGFGYPGFDSDALHTGAVLMGLIAQGKTLEEISKNGSTPAEFLLSKQESDGGFSGWGQSDVDTTSWSILGTVASGEQIPLKDGNTPLDYLLSAQNADGGFGYQEGQASAQDYTSEALIAFSAAGQEKNNAVNNTIGWLVGQQQASGCFSNAYTTALGAMALKAYGEDANSARDCLEGMQLADNGFGRNGSSNAVDTALAVIALEGKTLPTASIAPETSPGTVALQSTVKFTVTIRNTGKVAAKNVSISLQGIPGSWIQQETSTQEITQVNPNETVQAAIYVDLEETGQRRVFATVSGKGIAAAVNSPMVEFEVAAAQLNVSLSMQG